MYKALKTMNIELDAIESKQLIQTCDDQHVIIEQQRYTESITMLVGQSPSAWPIRSFQTLKLEDLLHLAGAHPEIIILGTGARTHHIPTNWAHDLLSAGVLITCMDNIHACGTFNILVSQQRHVMLALILGDTDHHDE